MRIQITLALIIGMFSSSISLSQEKVCIPNVWKGAEVKGEIYLKNGDTLSGKFTHLTPYNDIKTTHIIYKKDKKTHININRADITGYFDKKHHENHLKVYVNTDSTHYKKGCFFDQGKFLVIVESGKYTLVKDQLNYQSSISAYNQSTSEFIYYILLPNSKLVEAQINDLKAQLKSIIEWNSSYDVFLEDDDFTADDMIALLHFVNINQSSL